MRRCRIMLALCATTALSACLGGNDVPKLFNATSASSGPDEFSIVTQKPLQIPKDLADLPAPEAGGKSLADIRPADDAIAALGGKPGAKSLPAADADLINYAARFGITPDIVQIVATEDLEWRRRNKGKLLERVFNVDVYNRAYNKQALDPYTEIILWQKRGVRTPTPPPEAQEIAVSGSY